MKKCIIASCIGLLLSGCAGKVDYTQPTNTYKTNNSVTVNMPRSAVWKNMIPSLGGTFFVINNLDKDSGFINISYSGDPEKYIDCGVIDSYVMNARGERNYNFPAASSYQEYETMENGNLLFIKRKMNLEGRANIIVQDISSDSTLVTVNTRYVVTKDIAFSNPQGQSHHMNDSISFNTNGSASFPQQTTCYATGALEKELLSSLVM
ncbi:hypothetical protein ASV39_001573 [Vibrio parahaemolyticus]|nr:hypothetical protein [Vibrio parahaemolyticus]